MQAAKILQPGVQGVPYVVFALFSITLWQVFAGVVGASAQALSNSTSLLLQVKFPHEALIVKQCAQQLAISLISFVLSLAVLVFFRVELGWNVFLLPIMFIPIVLFAAGIGLVLAVVSVVVPDLERGLTYVLQLLLYVTPVVYTADVQSPVLQRVIDYNPLTYLIGDARDAVLFGGIRHADRYAYACAFSLFVFLFAWRLFFLSEEHVMERLG
jgi:lipopolysaccharide transport system permease protein